MNRRITIVTLILTAVVILTATGIVRAKSDIMLEDQEAEWGDDFANATELPNARYFMMIYGLLNATDDVDIFRMDFEDATEAWAVNPEVALCDDRTRQDFRAEVAVIGEGIETDSEKMQDMTLPFDIPDGMGIHVFDGIYTSIDFPSAGTYYLAIWSPAHTIGGYILGTGNLHPDDFTWDSTKQDAWDAVNSGRWMRGVCERAVSLQSRRDFLGMALRP